MQFHQPLVYPLGSEIGLFLSRLTNRIDVLGAVDLLTVLEIVKGQKGPEVPLC